MFILLKMCDGKERILNTDFIIDVEPSGDNKTNIIMHGGNLCQGITVDHKFSEIMSRLIR